EHRSSRPRRRDVRAGVPYDTDLLAESGVDHDGPIREPARHHRQRRARRDEPSPAELSPRAAATGVRDGAHRRMAHGQQRHAASGLRPLGELRRPRPPHQPPPQSDGRYVEHTGYITDIMNGLALEWLDQREGKPWSLFFAHKAVHPDAEQAADGTLR